ncbi:expressed unknown protein [Seminavis robusta]|uniref:Uncharacterized protein n=1 Tax=Seminavis robusta TaxID=568900 RepID=A0A9N8HFN4_9STRA|nr:expressed unknown protein [Seminavis robusta]|eukprot:Sro443_g144140.1 n/a (506) ;mRNA; r:47087-48604
MLNKWVGPHQLPAGVQGDDYMQNSTGSPPPSPSLATPVHVSLSFHNHKLTMNLLALIDVATRGILRIILSVLFLYILSVKTEWRVFRNRLHRSSLYSPSHCLSPPLKEPHYLPKSIHRKVRMDTSTRNPAFRVAFSRAKAECLDGDHVYMDRAPFWLVNILVIPAVMVQACSCMIWWSIRHFLHRNCWISIVPHDPSITAARIVMDSSMVLNFSHMETHPDSPNLKLATFVFPDMMLINHHSKWTMTLRLQLVLDKIGGNPPQIYQAWLDDSPVTHSQVCTLLSFAIVTCHIRLHAYANWAVNMESSSGMGFWDTLDSAITIMYNHLGYGQTHRYFWLYKWLGVMAREQDPLLFQQALDHNCAMGVPHHHNVKELAPYGRVIKFIVKLRPIFLKNFVYYQRNSNMFPGIDGEALFVRTFIHSLDHTFFEQIIGDVLWLDSNDTEFGAMADMAKFARCCYMEDLHLLPFSPKMKDRKSNPFYHSVYNAAHKVDPELADYIDTTIVK